MSSDSSEDSDTDIECLGEFDGATASTMIIEQKPLVAVNTDEKQILDILNHLVGPSEDDRMSISHLSVDMEAIKTECLDDQSERSMSVELLSPHSFEPSFEVLETGFVCPTPGSNVEDEYAHIDEDSGGNLANASVDDDPLTVEEAGIEIFTKFQQQKAIIDDLSMKLNELKKKHERNKKLLIEFDTAYKGKKMLVAQKDMLIAEMNKIIAEKEAKIEELRLERDAALLLEGKKHVKLLDQWTQQKEKEEKQWNDAKIELDQQLFRANTTIHQLMKENDVFKSKLGNMEDTIKEQTIKIGGLESVKILDGAKQREQSIPKFNPAKPLLKSVSIQTENFLPSSSNKSVNPVPKKRPVSMISDAQFVRFIDDQRKSVAALQKDLQSAIVKTLMQKKDQ